MSDRNFIGKQLISIKDRMKEKAKEKEELGLGAKNPTIINHEKTESREILSKADKEFTKALLAKKEDYLKTKNVVRKMVADTLAGLNKELDAIEGKKRLYSDSNKLLNTLLDDISGIEETKWEENNLSIELSEAMRIVEKARLENIILKEKLNLKRLQEPEDASRNGFSILDVISLSFSQTFKLGFSFFLPLIIGTLLASLIVSVAILSALGKI